LGAAEAAFYEQRGLILLDLEDWERAQKDQDRLIAAKEGKTLPPPPFAELSYRKGQEALARKEWTVALNQFAAALQINPRHARAFHDRGIARFRSAGLSRRALDEDLRDALKSDPALHLDPQYREIVIAYSKTQAEEYWKVDATNERKSAWQASLSWLNEIGKRLGDDPPLRIERAKMNRRLNNYEQGLTDLQNLPDTPEKLLIQGQIRFEKAFDKNRDAESLAAAFRDFDKAVQSDPKDALLVYWRGTSRHALLDQTKAMEDLKMAQSLGHDSADLHYQLSLVYQALKEYAPAIEQAGSALARIDSLTEEGYIANLFEQRNLSRATGIILLECDVRFCRASAQFQVSDFKSCADDCSQILTLDPKNYNAQVLRAEAFCKDQRHPEARRDYDAALLIAGSKEDKERVIRLKSNCARH
jgi:Tfp pilus assembly protein PilF